MYKHNASSIKESANKQFVSEADKQRWNDKAPGDHNHDEHYYTKEEFYEKSFGVENVVSGLNTIGASTEGVIKSMSISGNTVVRDKVIGYRPYLETGTLSTINGREVADTDKQRTDYIEVSVGDIIEYTKSNNPVNAIMIGYSSNKTFVTVIETSANGIFVIPRKCKYVRITHDNLGNAGLYITQTTPRGDFDCVGNIDSDGMNNIKIVSKSKNLLDLDNVMLNTKVENDGQIRTYMGGENEDTDPVGCITSDMIFVKGLPSLYLSIKKVQHSILFVEYDKNGKFLRRRQFERPPEDRNTTNYELKTNDDVWYIRLYLYKVSSSVLSSIGEYDIILSPTPVDKYYEYRRSEQVIKIPHRLDNVLGKQDELYHNQKDNKWYVLKRTHMVTIAESEISTVLDNSIVRENGKIRITLSYANIGMPTSKGEYSGALSEYKLMTRNEWDNWSDFNSNGIYMGHSAFGIVMVDTVAPNATREVIIQHFKENPLHIIYQLLEPTVTEVKNIDLQIKSFEGGTYVYLEDTEPSNKEVELPNSLNSSINSILIEAEDISSTIDKVSGLLDDQKVRYENIKEDSNMILCNSTRKGLVNEFNIKGETILNIFDPEKLKTNHVSNHPISAKSFEKNGVFFKIEGGTEHILDNEVYFWFNNEYIVPETGWYTFYTYIRTQNAQYEIYYENNGVLKQMVRSGYTDMSANGQYRAHVYLEKGTFRFRVDMNLDINVDRSSTSYVEFSNIMLLQGLYNVIMNYYIPYGLTSFGTGGAYIETRQYECYNSPLDYLKIDHYNNTLNETDRSVLEVEEGENRYRFVQYKTERPVKAGETYTVIGRVYEYNLTDHTVGVQFINKALGGSNGFSQGITSTGDFRVLLTPFQDTDNIRYYMNSYGTNEVGSRAVFDRRILILKGDYTDTDITIDSFNAEKHLIRDKAGNPIVLKRANETVYDSIEHINGKYIYTRRTGVQTFNGSNSEDWETKDQCNNEEYMIFRLPRNCFNDRPKVMERPGLLAPLKTNLFETITADETYSSKRYNEGASINQDARFDIRIKRSRLETEDVDGFKKWLSQNPLKVIFQLESYRTEQIENLTIPTYDKATSIAIKNPIIPNYEIVIDTSIGSVIKSLQDIVRFLEAEFKVSDMAGLSATLSAVDNKYKLNNLINSTNTK